MNQASQTNRYKYYNHLYNFLKSKIPLILLTTLAIVVFSVLIGGLPLLTQEVTKAYNEKNLDKLKELCVLGVGVFFVRGVAHFLKDFLSSKLSLELLHSMRTTLFNHLLTLDLNFFSKSKKGDLNIKISSELGNVSSTVFGVLQELIPAFIQVLVLGGYLFYTNAFLTFFLLLLIPAMAGISFFFGKFISFRTRRSQETSSDLSSYLIDFFSGVRLIKTFSTEDFESERFSDYSKKQKHRALMLSIVENLYTPILSFVQIVLALAFLYFALYSIQNNFVTNDEFFGYLMAVAMFIDPVRIIIGKYSEVKKLDVYLERTFSMLEIKPQIQSSNDFDLQDLNGNSSIEFRGVKFSYDDGEEVIKGIHCKIEDKSLVGIVGLSGAGKSTLISLMLRFYDPKEGAIYLGGKNIKDFSLRKLRRHFGVVLQESFLFTGTIKENIAYGYSDPKEEDLIDAAKKACIYKFIQTLPKGFETRLDEGAVNLSGGQKQRLAIARALYRKPQVLIFDEATSNIDAKSEALIRETIQSLKGKITIIIIAHRFATLAGADKVVVLEAGKVKEEGDHAKLMENKGLYSELYSEYNALKS